MGTNFYVSGHEGDDDPEYHIGKRSAAGLYCWDCKVSLFKRGEKFVHSGSTCRVGGVLYRRPPEEEWLDACPKCGKKYKPEPLDKSSAGRELGFNKSKPKRKRGVSTCSSFTWAQDPFAFMSKLTSGSPKLKVVVDEYGDEYTAKQFTDILLECPIVFKSIGARFS